MKIYDRPGFPNAARIRIVLAEKGLDTSAEFVPVDLIAAEHKQSAFLALNPSGVIPVLELDDGTFISEATAITEYLDNLDGDPVLTGSSPKEKALIHMMQRRAEAFVLDAVGNYFHYGTPGLGDAVQAYKSLEWEGRAEWAERNKTKVQEGYRYFDEVLSKSPFVAGERMSMADITLFAGLLFADIAGISPSAELHNLSAWRTRIAEVPSVKDRSGQNLLQEDLRRLGF